MHKEQRDHRLYKDGQGIKFTDIPKLFPSKTEFRFSTGQVLDLYSRPDGECKCIITHNGEQVLDLAQYLPQNSRFVNKQYLDKSYEEKFGTASIDGILQSKRANRRPFARKIKNEIGKPDEYLVNAESATNSPKDIFVLLHEMGHLVDFVNEHPSPENEQSVHELSRSETAAWLNGLKIAVDIFQKYGINLLEFFKNFEEVETFIKQYLGTYRKSAEYEGASQEVTKNLFDLGEWDTFRQLGSILFERKKIE